MRYLTLAIGNEILSVDNSWLGVETVCMNGEVVSEKFSFLGALHTFSWTENGNQVNYEVKIGLSFTGIGYNIRRNDEPILLSNQLLKSSEFSWLDILVFFVLFISSMALGYTVARGFLIEAYSFSNTLIPLLVCIFGAIYFFWKRAKRAKTNQ